MYNIESNIKRNDSEIAVRMMDNHIEYFRKQNDIWKNKREQDENYILEESDVGYVLKSLVEKKLYIYDAMGKLCTISDRNNNCICFYYNNGVLEKWSLLLVRYLRFFYEENKLKSIRDNINREISYCYKGEYLTSVCYPNGAEVKYQYDTHGNITKIWDEYGTHYITNQYDKQNRVVKQQTADGEEYIYMYDDVNQVNTIVTVSLNRTVQYAYNKQRMVTKIMYQDKTYVEQKYDNSDNLIWYQDRMGNVTKYIYDTKGNLLQQTEADGYIQYKEYDKENNLIKVWDNAGAERVLAYDERG